MNLDWLRWLRIRVVVFLCGLLTVLAAGELALRAAGWISRRILVPQEAPRAPKDGYTILCLGDSMTFGLGAQRENSYPRQLERALCSATQGAYHVVNAGRCAYNTRKILSRLPKQLAENRPELVLVLASDANYWDFEMFSDVVAWGGVENWKIVRLLRLLKDQWDGLPGFRGYFHKKPAAPARLEWPPAVPGTGWDVSVQEAEQLSAAATGSPGEMAERGQRNKDEGRWEQAVVFFRKAIVQGRRHLHYDLGVIYLRKGNDVRAVECFREGIEQEPDDALSYLGVGRVWVQREKWKEAFPWVMRAIETEPTDRTVYEFLVPILSHLGGPYYDEAIDRLSQLPARGLVRDYLRLCRFRDRSRETVDRWIYQDLTRIVRMCREHGARVILQTYPHGPEANRIILQVARDQQVPVVAWADMLDGLTRATGEPEEAFLAPDGNHLNDRGYGEVAKYIVEAMRRYKLLGLH